MTYKNGMLTMREDSFTNNVLIIGELNFGYIQSFAAVQFLFVFQNVVVEEFLQFLVTIIDAELFERIDRKIFCEIEIR